VAQAARRLIATPKTRDAQATGSGRQLKESFPATRRDSGLSLLNVTVFSTPHSKGRRTHRRTLRQIATHDRTIFRNRQIIPNKVLSVSASGRSNSDTLYPLGPQIAECHKTCLAILQVIMAYGLLYSYS
jgi:hypothetical protein